MTQLGANRADLWSGERCSDQELNKMDLEKSTFVNQQTKSLQEFREESVVSDEYDPNESDQNPAMPSKVAKGRSSSNQVGVLPKKRERTVFTEYQLAKLESAFQKEKYPDYEFKISLSKRLGLTEPKIQIWFKNRRAKLKRQLKEEKNAFGNNHASQKPQQPETCDTEIPNFRNTQNPPPGAHPEGHAHSKLQKSISFRAEVSKYPDTIKMPLITQRDHNTPFQKHKPNIFSNSKYPSHEYYHQQQHPNYDTSEASHAFQAANTSIHTHNHHHHFHRDENYYGFMSPYMDLHPLGVVGSGISSVQLRMQDDSLDTLMRTGSVECSSSLKFEKTPISKRYQPIIGPGQLDRSLTHPSNSGRKGFGGLNAERHLQQGIMNLLPYYDASTNSTSNNDNFSRNHRSNSSRTQSNLPVTQDHRKFTGDFFKNSIQANLNSYFDAQSRFPSLKTAEFLRNSTSETAFESERDVAGVENAPLEMQLSQNSQNTSDDATLPPAKRQLYDNTQDSENQETVRPNLNEINDMRSMCI